MRAYVLEHVEVFLCFFWSKSSQFALSVDGNGRALACNRLLKSLQAPTHSAE